MCVFNVYYVYDFMLIIDHFGDVILRQSLGLVLKN